MRTKWVPCRKCGEEAEEAASRAKKRVESASIFSEAGNNVVNAKIAEAKAKADAVRAVKEAAEKVLRSAVANAQQKEGASGDVVQAATRGDGETGEDVTANVRTLGSVPLRLSAAQAAIPSRLEVRGEIYISVADFETFNLEARKRGDKPMINPR